MEITDFRDDNMDLNSLSLNIETSKRRQVASSSSNPYTQQNPMEHPQQIINDTKRGYELDLVMRDYETVIKLNPDFVYAYFNRGNIYCQQKDYRMALADYNEAIKRNPDFAEAYFNRGLTRLYLGDTNRGIEDLSKAGELGIVNAYSIIKKMTAD